MPRTKLKSADEYDALTRARRYYFWRPGEIKRIQRRVNKRERHEARQALREGREI